MQPGETITPGNTPQPTPSAPEQPKPHQQWQFKSAETPPANPRPAQPSTTANFSWTASEYIAHQKTLSWYVFLGLGAVGLSGLIMLLTHDRISAGFILIVCVIFGITAARQPRTLPYAIDHDGIKIGQKFYSYADFKSFSVLDEGPISYLLLLPMKRFMPGLTIYYPPELEDGILNVLSNYLPHEVREVDLIDRLMRKIRF